jgi:hypothetical protein
VLARLGKIFPIHAMPVPHPHGSRKRRLAQRDRVITNESDNEWTDRTRTLLTAADENQILEFSMLVGHYVMAAMMLDVAGCEVEPAFSLDTR